MKRIETKVESNWPIHGHQWAVDHLRKSMAHGRVRHAYLIVGAESVGKETLARAFAMTLNCLSKDDGLRPCGQCRSCKLILSGNHPDILYSELDPNTGALKIEEIRSVMQRLSLKPFEASYRVAIFRDFDHAQPRAQDALLKTLEEPPPYAILILLAQSAEGLLPTITSRSQTLHLRPLPVETVRDTLVEHFQADDEQANLLAHLSGGRMGWAIRALTEPEMLDQRGQALDMLENLLTLNRVKRFELAEDLSKEKLALTPLLELWQTYWRDLALLCEGSGLEPMNADRESQLRRLSTQLTTDDALAALQATREMLGYLHLSVNTRLALEVMFLDYPGLSKSA
jgi:DNA polymerase III subunit delta'